MELFVFAKKASSTETVGQQLFHYASARADFDMFRFYQFSIISIWLDATMHPGNSKNMLYVSKLITNF